MGRFDGVMILSDMVEYQKKRPAAPSKLSQSDLERIQTVAAYLSSSIPPPDRDLCAVV